MIRSNGGEPAVDSTDDRRSCGIVTRRAIGRGTRMMRGSLWIVPDLWKTHRTRFPQGRWTRRRVHTLHRRTHVLIDGWKKKAVR
jgi:hypothetical protein